MKLKMKRLNQWVIPFFATLMLVLLAACGGASTPANTPPSSGEQDQTADGEAGAEVVTIGFSGPLSGGAAFYGKNGLSGLEMAVEEINNAGGIEVGGKKVTFKIEALDDKYQPSETATNAKRLVQEFNAPVVFIPHSGGIMAVQQFNEQDQFIIGAYTSEPKVTETGNRLTMRIPPKYDGYIEPFIQYLMGRFGNKVALVPGTHAYAKDWTELFRPAWEAAGGEVVAENPMDYTTETDFTSGVSNALSKNPDALFVGGPSEPTALVIKTAREQGFKGGFAVMDQAKLEEMAAVLGGYELLEGAIGTLPLIMSDAPGVAGFVEAYNSKYNKNPGSEAGLHYVAMHIVAKAMEAAGTTTDAQAIHAHIQTAIDNLDDKHRLYYITGIDDAGGLVHDVRIAAVENGEVVAIPVK